MDNARTQNGMEIIPFLFAEKKFPPKWRELFLALIIVEFPQ
ncbi:hypothetical protein JOC77_002462 [Peribacillus deserti]|uniref:Uncharacterized protein n=1 Tax=Peribacillus deserti TaxID=673318 RepID=A0ABS2QKN2_9BACI|nr:hypothetical protein [Peribacillus deserti]